MDPYEWNEEDDNFDSILDFTELENEINQICDKGELKEMISLQLSEIEMLQSMYSNPGEFCIDNYGILADMYDFSEGKSSETPPQIDFQINLSIDNLKYQIHVNFPHEYPACEPDIYVRNDKFTRDQQSKLNTDLAYYIDSLDRGEICVGSAIFWLQENASNYITQTASLVTEKSTKNTSTNEFCRYWIYSHHIYSKIKRREMLALAGDYSITGFVLPGRPGIICIEGTSQDASDWWLKIKSMAWKKIICRKCEKIPVKEGEDFNKLRKFDSFKEIAFQSQNLTSKHMDMGELYKYLEEHDCAYAFKEYFGLDGKSA
ncbi:RWD domain-containing protein 2A isoform X2 [Chrysoperla carnea]|nr:RWD domain-containing protein 2A isoform X2 [Chrysoperla carnea]XP_044727981.1 RWD domain-containing protein 2A isoform X2 [Chrysoperla carnea]